MNGNVTEAKAKSTRSVKTLSYLGDAVFELCVRETLAAGGDSGDGKDLSLRELNKRAKMFVSDKAQSAMYHSIYGKVSEEERAVMRRGRNLYSKSRAKNAGTIEYRHATGLETLFGYLYLSGERERLNEVFSLCRETTELN